MRQILTARAHGKERWVTFNDLVDVGALAVTKDGQYYPPNEPPPNTPPTPTPSPTPPTPPPSTGAPPGVKCMYPPAPTNVTATGMFEGVFLDWDVIPYPYRLTHDVAEIFRGEKDDVQLAALVGTGVGTSYWDAIKTPGKTYYYWVRFKNLCGERGPYQGTHGVKAKVLFPSSYLIGLLSDDITMSRLYGDLGSRIISIEDDSKEALMKYVELSRRLGLPADYRFDIGTDVVEGATHLCERVAEEFPRSTFFTGQLIFPHVRLFHRLLHNETAFAIQRRLQWDGMTNCYFTDSCQGVRYFIEQIGSVPPSLLLIGDRVTIERVEIFN